jgi:hypothetical protein
MALWLLLAAGEQHGIIAARGSLVFRLIIEVYAMPRFALFGAEFTGGAHADTIVAHPRASLAYVYDIKLALGNEP